MPAKLRRRKQPSVTVGSLETPRGEETCEQKDNATSGYREKALQKAPLISVIVPSYNKPEYLPECLRSIQAQTFRDWECIVVSDGSPRVGEIRAAVTGMGDNRFRLVEHEVNRGPGAARNTGAKNARGRILVFVDSDDIVAAAFLEKVAEAFREAPETSMVTTCLQRFGTENRVIKKKIDGIGESILIRNQFSPAGSLAVRTEFFRKVGGFTESSILKLGMEDTDFWIRAFEAGASHVMIEEPLYLYRSESGSLSDRLALDAHRVRKYLVERHLKRHGSERETAQFIAAGYRKASFASLKKRRFVRALRLRVGYLYWSRKSIGIRAAVREYIRFARSVYDALWGGGEIVQKRTTPEV